MIDLRARLRSATVIDLLRCVSAFDSAIIRRDDFPATLPIDRLPICLSRPSRGWTCLGVRAAGPFGSRARLEGVCQAGAEFRQSLIAADKTEYRARCPIWQGKCADNFLLFFNDLGDLLGQSALERRKDGKSWLDREIRS